MTTNGFCRLDDKRRLCILPGNEVPSRGNCARLRIGAHVLAAITSLLFIGCEDKSPETDQLTASTEQAPQSKEAATSGPPAATNDAYLVTYDENDPVTFWRVHEGEVHRLSVDCRSSFELQLDTDKQGRLWLLCDGALWRVEGSQPVKVDPPESASVRKLVVGLDGSVWVHGHRLDVLHRRQDQGWRKVDVAKEFQGQALAMAVDKGGRPWISDTSGVVAYRDAGQDAGQWKRVEVPSGEQVRNIHPMWDGSVLLETYESYLRARDGTILGKEQVGPSRHRFVAAGPEGYLVLRDGTQLGFVDANGKLAQEFDLAKQLGRTAESVSGHRIGVVDSGGRVWLRLYLAGLAVLGNREISTWEPGHVAKMERLIVRRVAVAGKGPKLPSFLPAVRGQVTGRIDAKPNTPVEMCLAGGGAIVDATGPAFRGHALREQRLATA